MNLEQLLVEYGCLAVLIGCFLEGETMLLLGGYAAHRGYLDLPMVMLAGLLGGLIGDQLYFHLGRRYGTRWLARKPRWQAAVARIEGRLHRHRDMFLFGFRFLYGLRMVSPLVIGLTRVSAVRYTVLCALGGITWAVSITLLAYLFGPSVDHCLGTLQTHQLHLLGLLVGIGAVYLAVQRHRARRTLDQSVP